MFTTYSAMITTAIVDQHHQDLLHEAAIERQLRESPRGRKEEHKMQRIHGRGETYADTAAAQQGWRALVATMISTVR